MKNIMKSLIWFVVILSPCMAQDSVAQDDPGMEGMLDVAKMTGACGILNLMVQFQANTKLEGGDEFVTRFWSTVAAREAVPAEEMVERCNRTIELYNKITEAAATLDATDP